MASRRVEERKAYHKRYKEDVEREGKSFFPHAMFHDTVMSLVVVSVIVALACVWYYTAEGSEDPGLLGPHYTEEADPGTTNFIPRPDWFFYFLFYLLRIFKWPDTVVLGTVGVPNILLAILIALPFIDLRRERRLLRRPVAIVAAIVVVLAMGTLTYKGATAEEALGSELVEAVPEWAETQGFADERGGARRREDLRPGRVRPVPPVPRHGRGQPRRAGPLRHRRDGPRGRVLRGLRDESGAVRQQRDAALRGPRRGEPAAARRLPRRLQGPAGLGIHERLPRRHRRVGRAVRRPAAARALRVGVRGRARGLRRRDRGARDRALRRRDAAARGGARAFHRRRRRT